MLIAKHLPCDQISVPMASESSDTTIAGVDVKFVNNEEELPPNPAQENAQPLDENSSMRSPPQCVSASLIILIINFLFHLCSCSSSRSFFEHFNSKISFPQLFFRKIDYTETFSDHFESNRMIS